MKMEMGLLFMKDASFKRSEGHANQEKVQVITRRTLLNRVSQFSEVKGLQNANGAPVFKTWSMAALDYVAFV